MCNYALDEDMAVLRLLRAMKKKGRAKAMSTSDQTLLEYLEEEFPSYYWGKEYEWVWRNLKPAPPRTSDTDPIRVDWFSGEDVALRGSLGLSFAPGKKQTWAIAGTHDRDLDKDLKRLRRHHKVDTIVPLVEHHEMVSLGIPDLMERARWHGFYTYWFPFPDMSVPYDDKGAVKLIRYIISELYHGRNVLIHCKGGLGRSGCIAACVLVYLGHHPQDAIRLTRAVRKGAIQTKAQELYVYDYWNYLLRVYGPAK